MIYKDSNNNLISSLKDWEDFLFRKSKKEKHWKKGRSAYEIANFLLNGDGEAILKNIIEEIIGENIIFNYAIPELEIRFDTYGHGREHDVGIYGNTNSGKTFFVGIESKVDEVFNEKISDIYFKAKSKELNGIRTNSTQRIEKLLQRNFSSIVPDLFNLRYQLLYSTVGTIDAKYLNNYADLYFLIIIVFKTELYDECKGIENHKDFIQFVNALGAIKIKSYFNSDIYNTRIDDKNLNIVYLNINS